VLVISQTHHKVGQYTLFPRLDGIRKACYCEVNVIYENTFCIVEVLFYTRLTSQAKSKKLAVIAAMRKLILMAFSIFKSEQNYQPLLAKI